MLQGTGLSWLGHRRSRNAERLGCQRLLVHSAAALGLRTLPAPRTVGLGRAAGGGCGSPPPLGAAAAGRPATSGHSSHAAAASASSLGSARLGQRRGAPPGPRLSPSAPAAAATAERRRGPGFYGRRGRRQRALERSRSPEPSSSPPPHSAPPRLLAPSLRAALPPESPRFWVRAEGLTGVWVEPA